MHREPNVIFRRTIFRDKRCQSKDGSGWGTYIRQQQRGYVQQWIDEDLHWQGRQSIVGSLRLRLTHENSALQRSFQVTSNTLFVGLTNVQAKKHVLYLGIIKAVPLWPS